MKQITKYIKVFMLKKYMCVNVNVYACCEFGSLDPVVSGVLCLVAFLRCISFFFSLWEVCPAGVDFGQCRGHCP